MAHSVVLVTGANGEIGQSLLPALASHGGYELVTLDLNPLPDAMRPLVGTVYTGNVTDQHLLSQLAAHHDFDLVFHLAALLSTRGERDPDLSHHVNVEGTLNVLRIAHQQSARRGRPVRFLFPSSIAVYGLPSAEEKRKAGRVREEEWNLPVTMYGINKLYCEHLGRYFTSFVGRLGALASAARVDFRALRFPGLMSAETRPAGGTSDYGPEMIHAAAQGAPYSCFVDEDATLPFMAMPDAVRALFDLAQADRARLTSSVYNIGAFSIRAGDIAERVRRAFPGARIDYKVDEARAGIVASWPQDVNDDRARSDWGWRPQLDADRAFDTYLVPRARALHAGDSP
jgi:nucleoside-diphosphate-sugar epimerase